MATLERESGKSGKTTAGKVEGGTGKICPLCGGSGYISVMFADDTQFRDCPLCTKSVKDLLAESVPRSEYSAKVDQIWATWNANQSK